MTDEVNAELRRDSFSIMTDGTDASFIKPSQEIMSGDLRRKRLIYLTLTVLINCCAFWISRRYKKEIWKFSEGILNERYLMPSKLDFYFWFFKVPINKFMDIIVPFTFMFICKKPVALKIITIYVLADLVAQHMRLFLKEKRVSFDDSVPGEYKCSCSFGMPSVTSVEISFILMVYFHELLIKPDGISKEAKTCVKVLCGFLLVKSLLAKVYFAQHTVDEVIIGSLVGIFFFMLTLSFEDYLHTYFSNFLYADLKYAAQLYTVFIVVIVTNVFLWQFYLDRSIKNFTDFTSIRCTSCFKDQLREIRRNGILNLQFNVIVFGVLVGSRTLKPLKNEETEDITNISECLSCRGLARCIIMGLICLPTLVLIYPHVHQKMDLMIYMLLCTLVYFVIGFAMAYLFTQIVVGCDLEVQGDIQQTRGNTVLDDRNHTESSWYLKTE